MARQGTYVTVPGGAANWAQGLSDSLANLSKSYLQQGAAEDERARLAASEAESKRRWELDREHKLNTAAEAKRQWEERQKILLSQEQRAKTKAEADAANLARQEAQRKWISETAATFDPRDIGARLAEQAGARQALDEGYGRGIAPDDTDVDDSQFFDEADRQAYLQSEADAARLADKHKVYQEDAVTELARQYQEKFGEAIDTSILAPMVADLPSHKALQDAETAAAAELQERRDKEYEAAFKGLKERLPSDSRISASKKAAAGAKSYGAIDTVALAKKFADDWNWIPFNDTEMQEAHKLAETLKGVMQQNKFSAAEAEAGIKAALNKLTGGGSLTKIDDDLDAATKFAREGALAHRAATKSAKLTDDEISAIEAYDELISKGLTRVTPTNIKAKEAADYRALLDEIAGRPATKEEPKTTPSSQKTSANTTGASGKTTTQEVMENLGLATPVVEESPKAEIPTEKPVQTAGTASRTTGAPISRTEALQALTQDDAYANRATKDPGVKASAAVKQSYLDSLMQQLDDAHRAGNPVQADILRNKVDEVQQNVRKTARHEEGTKLVDRVNSILGEDAITTDTLFVLPYNKHGEDKSWAEVVNDINSRESIKFSDGIDEKEYEAALNDPELQAEMVAKANSLIANDALFRTSTGRMGQQVGAFFEDSIIEPVKDLTSTFFGSNFDPTAEGYTNTEAVTAAEERALQDRLAALDLVDEFARSELGQVDLGRGEGYQAWDAFTGFSEDSPVVRNISTAAALSATPYAWLKAPFSVARGTVAGNRELARQLLTRTPKAVPKVAPPPSVARPVFTGLPKPAGYVAPRWKALDKPAVNRADARRLDEWLQKYANPGGLK